MNNFSHKTLSDKLHGPAQHPEFVYAFFMDDLDKIFIRTLSFISFILILTEKIFEASN